jgi:drug/metabolite transporter (DMT)-like permease
VAAVLGSMATMFRLNQQDFLLASSFWVGFGWLDTMPKPPFQAFVVALVALAAVALFIHIGRHQQVRRFLWLLILGVGSVTSLALYTVSTQGLPMALGGRYLVGWYLCVLGVIGAALTLDHSSPQRERPGSEAPSRTGRAALLLVVAGSIHAYCLCFVLQRYF